MLGSTDTEIIRGVKKKEKKIKIKGKHMRKAKTSDTEL